MSWFRSKTSSNVWISRVMLTDAQRHFLESERVGRLATADAAGVPQVVPVCYALAGTNL